MEHVEAFLSSWTPTFLKLTELSCLSARNGSSLVNVYMRDDPGEGVCHSPYNVEGLLVQPIEGRNTVTSQYGQHPQTVFLKLLSVIT